MIMQSYLETFLRTLLWMAMSFVSFNAEAGMAAGPYIVWVNLEQSSIPEPTSALHDYLQVQRGDEFCGGTAMGWIVYTHTRPTGMTNQLISRALVDKNPTARKKLVSLIKSFKDSDVGDGVDGVVAFTNQKGAHMIAINAHGRISESGLIGHVEDAPEVMKAFCKVSPENFRQ